MVDAKSPVEYNEKRRTHFMDTLTTILIIGIAAQGIAGAVLILAGPVYAWNDR